MSTSNDPTSRDRMEHLNTATTPSEPHKIIVKVWYNAYNYDVIYNSITSNILQKLYHKDPQQYYNPTPKEWDQLREYVI